VHPILEAGRSGGSARNSSSLASRIISILLAKKPRKKERKSKIASETIGLIREMAKNNPLWGAERIQGELLKLGIKVSNGESEMGVPGSDAYLSGQAVASGSERIYSLFQKPRHLNRIYFNEVDGAINVFQVLFSQEKKLFSM
jgi:hypothetical protein